jgi:hypothetical protein
MRLLEMTAAQGVDAARIGTAGGTELRIRLGARSFAWSTAELHDLWWNSISHLMK